MEPVGGFPNYVFPYPIPYNARPRPPNPTRYNSTTQSALFDTADKHFLAHFLQEHYHPPTEAISISPPVSQQRRKFLNYFLETRKQMHELQECCDRMHRIQNQLSQPQASDTTNVQDSRLHLQLDRLQKQAKTLSSKLHEFQKKSQSPEQKQLQQSIRRFHSKRLRMKKKKQRKKMHRSQFGGTSSSTVPPQDFPEEAARTDRLQSTPQQTQLQALIKRLRLLTKLNQTRQRKSGVESIENTSIDTFLKEATSFLQEFYKPQEVLCVSDAKEQAPSKEKEYSLAEGCQTMESLIKIRRAWDNYLVEPGYGTRIPTHFVLPPRTPSDDWKKTISTSANLSEIERDGCKN